MASNKDSKTSKTAHVMNLLSKNRGAEPAPQPAAPQPEPAEVPAAEPVPAAPIPPIISSINADAAVSSQIKDALEAVLDEADPPRPAVQTPPQQPAVPEAEPPAAAVPQPVPEAAPAPQPEAPREEEPFAAAIEAVHPQDSPAGSPVTAERPAYINVMQVLVEEKAEKYMKLSGMCCCDTCKVDVKAYALNHLPPKYVVMSRGEMIPKLTFYELQHSSDITAQLMKACTVVAGAPHHTRKA